MIDLYAAGIEYLAQEYHCHRQSKDYNKTVGENSKQRDNTLDNVDRVLHDFIFISLPYILLSLRLCKSQSESPGAHEDGHINQQRERENSFAPFTLLSRSSKDLQLHPSFFLAPTISARPRSLVLLPLSLFKPPLIMHASFCLFRLNPPLTGFPRSTRSCLHLSFRYLARFLGPLYSSAG